MQSTQYPFPILMKLGFADRFSKNPQISNFIKICPLEAELFYVEGRTDRHDEANGHFSLFCESAQQL
jgi:hypothetical protein